MNFPRIDLDDINYQAGVWGRRKPSTHIEPPPLSFKGIESDERIKDCLRLFDLDNFSGLSKDGRFYLLAGAMFYGINAKKYAFLTAQTQKEEGDPGLYVWHLVWILWQLLKEPGYTRVKWRCLFALEFAESSCLAEWSQYFPKECYIAELLKRISSEEQVSSLSQQWISKTTDEGEKK